MDLFTAINNYIILIYCFFSLFLLFIYHLTFDPPSLSHMKLYIYILYIFLLIYMWIMMISYYIMCTFLWDIKFHIIYRWDFLFPRFWCCYTLQLWLYAHKFPLSLVFFVTYTIYTFHLFYYSFSSFNFHSHLYVNSFASGSSCCLLLLVLF